MQGWYSGVSKVSFHFRDRVFFPASQLLDHTLNAAKHPQKMASQRSFGVAISGNRGFACELNEATKIAILTLLHEGISARKVAARFNTSHTTVNRILKRWKEDQTVKNKARSGRPLKLSHSQRLYILRLIRKNRAITWNALVGSMGGEVSKSTIRRVVRRHYARKWKSMKRPKLTKVAAKARLSWARLWRPRIEELMEV